MRRIVQEKTVWLYLLLVLLFIFRLASVCNKDLPKCEETLTLEIEGARYQKDTSFHFEEDSFEGIDDGVPTVWESFNIYLKRIRHSARKHSRSNLPSPHSELLTGMTIGLDDLYKVPKFKEMLKRTGTIHVVVVSGFNISLVYRVVIKAIGSPYKSTNLMLAVIITLLYALLSGFNPPVIRAWIMGSVISLGKYYGRNVNILFVLVLSALVMLIANPLFIYSLSFQLSFMATLGLVLYSESVSKIVFCVVNRKSNTKRAEYPSESSVFVEDLSATVAAQLMVWPIISYNFSTFSVVSFVVNPLILWAIPFITVWGMLYLTVAQFSVFFGDLLANVLFYPLEFFTTMVEFFSELQFAEINLKINLFSLMVYYTLLFIFWWKLLRKGGS